jgi:glucosylceramidase
MGVQLEALPQELTQTEREQLTFVGCGGPGRLLVRVDDGLVLSRFQHRPCRQRTIAWDAPGCSASGYSAAVSIKIGARPWSRTVSVAVGAPQPAPGKVNVTVTSADLTQALASMPPVTFGAINPAVPTIHVSDGTRYQQMIGFGAAMTDSSAWLLYDVLGPDQRTAAMSALFGPCGIGIDHVRVPIGASDFTATGVPYSYDDMPLRQTDPSLTDFSIAHDEAYILPALKMMLALNPNLQILASPWSAPAWMKTNDLLGNGDFRGWLLPTRYQTYADYLVRFLEDYAAAGVPISAVTPENEAGTGSVYPGMNLDEDAFLTAYLAPALKAAGLTTSVYGLDSSGLADGEDMLSGLVRNSIAGLAWHCYLGLEQMSELHALDPSASLIMDECSPGIVAYPTTETVIASARNYAQAVELWNLALDPSGGPKQLSPGCYPCDGLLTVQEGVGSAALNLNYYQLGQVSKFVQRGAVRIASDRWVSDFSNPDGTYGVTDGLDNVAFLNPDGSKVLVAYDNSSQPARFQVAWDGQGFSYTLGPGGTATFVWQ